VQSGPSSNLGVSLTSRLGPTPSSMTSNISFTFSECMITVVTPAAVANSAAINFVDIPPVPRDVPSVAVDTVCQYKYISYGRDIPCRLTFSMSRTTLTGFASGLLLGLSVYKHSTSVSRNRKSAWTIDDDIADKVSLSPNLISCPSAPTRLNESGEDDIPRQIPYRSH